MGTGYRYHCAACGEEREFSLGIGFAFPRVCERTLGEVEEGLYGDALQRAVRDRPLVGVCAERVVFECEGCGHWETGIDASLYEPDDLDEALSEQFGIKTVAEWGHLPYLMSYKIGNGWHLLAPYEPTCPECGRTMRKRVSDDAADRGTELRCPRCGSMNGLSESFLWD